MLGENGGKIRGGGVAGVLRVPRGGWLSYLWVFSVGVFEAGRVGFLSCLIMGELIAQYN